VIVYWRLVMKKNLVGGLRALPLVVVLACSEGATIARADILTAVFSDPVLSGNVVNDPAAGDVTFTDNSATATYSIINSGSTLQWGTGPDLNIPAGEQFSQLSFAGTPVTLGPGVQQIGTISYLNGTSDLGSVIFGATISFFDGDTLLGTDNVIVSTTENQFSGTGLTGAQLQTDADYINICGNSSNICSSSLESYEDSETGTLTPVVANLFADLDFDLTGIVVPADQSAFGTVGNLPPLGAVPEPSAPVLTLTAVGLCIGLARRGLRSRPVQG
jgi:hypothetical protein